MDQLTEQLREGCDVDASIGHWADLNTYQAIMEERCTCEGTCTCDESDLRYVPVMLMHPRRHGEGP